MKEFIKDSFLLMFNGIALVLYLLASVLWIISIAILVLVPSVFITIGLIYGAVKIIGYLLT